MTNEKKPDRRVAYTKLALRNALVKLMHDQHISGITVKSVCELADVNRSTFYLHYRDQYDLLHQIEREVLATLTERLSDRQVGGSTEQLDSDGWPWPISIEALTEVLEYAYENADLARVLLSENCDFAFQQDIMGVAQLIVFQMNDSFSQRTREYIIAYGINGCVALAEKWLREKTPEPPREIAELMLKVLYFGTYSFAKAPDAV
jgi:AcrR family transcriptional regulator